MKHILDFNDFLNENINEASVPGNIEDMEKLMPKIVNTIDFLETWELFGSSYSALSIENLIRLLVDNPNILDYVLTQSQYVSYQKMRNEMGTGYGGKPVEWKAEYDRLVQNREYGMLFIHTERYLGKEKFNKKIALALEKALGKFKLSQMILKIASEKSGGPYDRHFIMRSWFDKISAQLLHNKQELKDYLKNIK